MQFDEICRENYARIYNTSMSIILRLRRMPDLTGYS